MSRRKPKVIELDAGELRAIVERTKTSALDAQDHEKLKTTIETCLWMMAELEKKGATLDRLRKSLSINTKKTEKTSEVLKGTSGAKPPPDTNDGKSDERPEKKKKPKGHGRNGASTLR